MATIRGTVVKVNSKEQKTRNGMKQKIGLKVGETWYNLLVGQEHDSKKYEGATLSFEAGGEYNDIDVKSIKIESTAPAAASAPSSGGTKPKTEWAGTVGVRTGMAINNAVALAAAGAIRLESIPAVAKEIIRLSADLELEYDEIMSDETPWRLKSKPPTAPVAAAQAAAAPAVQTTVALAAESTPAATPAAKPARRSRTAAAAPAASPPAQAETPAPVATASPAPVKAASAPAFDDDIPF